MSTSQGNLDVIDLKVLADISKFGWSDISVFPTEDDGSVPFNYTVGLSEYDHPDLVMTGLANEQAHGVMWAAFDQIAHHGAKLRPNQLHDKILVGFQIAVIEVLDPLNEDYPMSMTHRITGQVSAIQLVWPDEEGRYPWSKGWTNEHEQPLLGVWNGPS